MDFTETENQSHPEKAESSEEYLNQSEKISTEKESQKPGEGIQHSPITVKADQEASRIKEWKTMLNLSETLVQLVANYNGYKVYQSTM
ncbi:hypothetical protein EG345_18370 [Chryseobacterium carnipullorum]|nr:hypothetical protein [Chryseobacterium carnipullorum]AZA66439.1 hypothetical protein EG345_18370 [Chryseobacterium carnipullorum]